jgi:hypothetical protein
MIVSKEVTMFSLSSMLNSGVHYIHPVFEIPADVQRHIFPDATLSVSDFLLFPLPNISGAALLGRVSIFFSHRDPNIKEIVEIQKILLPPAETLTEVINGDTQSPPNWEDATGWVWPHSHQNLDPKTVVQFLGSDQHCRPGKIYK